MRNRITLYINQALLHGNDSAMLASPVFGLCFFVYRIGIGFSEL